VELLITEVIPEKLLETPERWPFLAIKSPEKSSTFFAQRSVAKKKGKRGRKPIEAGALMEPAPQPAMHGGVSFKDMRAVKEIRNRLGPARMRELVALMAD
jgi:hypothetical protein